jgi:hypothetical protein
MSERNKNGLVAIFVLVVFLAVCTGLLVSELQAQAYLDHFADDVVVDNTVIYTGAIETYGSYSDGKLSYTGFGGAHQFHIGGDGIAGADYLVINSTGHTFTPSTAVVDFSGVDYVDLGARALTGTGTWTAALVELTQPTGTAVLRARDGTIAKVQWAIDSTGNQTWYDTSGAADTCLERTAANELSVCAGDTFKAYLARFGNATDYADFDSDGVMTLAGSARVWIGVDLTPSTTGHPTSNPPGTTDYQDVPFDAYSNTTEEQVFFVWHVAHDFATGTANVKGHFGGMVALDPAGQAEYIAMGFQWTKIAEDSVFDISTPDGGGAVNITLGDAEGNYLWHSSQEGTVDTTGWAVDDIIVFRFFRDTDDVYAAVSDHDDDYAGDVLIGAYHLEYLADKLGAGS